MADIVHQEPTQAPRPPVVDSGEAAVGLRSRRPPHAEAPVIHEYDGIQEQDNHLPNWWLATLFLTIAFSIGYWFYYHEYEAGETSWQAYQREMAALRAAEAARARAGGQVTPAMLTTLSRDENTVNQGRQIFASNCAACHGPNGGGTIGPNLTDEYWIHGGSPDRIYRTISEGVPSKGMPAWGAQLGAERVQAVTAFLLTFRNTNVPGGKAPQGEREP